MVTELPVQRLAFLDRYRYTRPDPALVPLLNTVQKHRLADALFASNEPGEGDEFLMQLVKDFGDPRFPAFALARLHRFEEEAPSEAESWLRALAASLKNRQIDELADAYVEDATYFEDEEEETEAATETDDAAEANDATDEEEAEAASGDEEDVSEEAEETPADPEAEAAEAARIAAGTERATRKRSALLKALLVRIDLLVSTGQLVSN
jgi:hypothetical protein